MHLATKIVDIMGSNTINVHCYIISSVKDNGKDTDILYTFNLIDPPGYMIKIYQKIYYIKMLQKIE